MERADETRGDGRRLLRAEARLARRLENNDEGETTAGGIVLLGPREPARPAESAGGPERRWAGEAVGGRDCGSPRIG